jgi:hypothetical protein
MLMNETGQSSALPDNMDLPLKDVISHCADRLT